jgi:hypothetical protein
LALQGARQEEVVVAPVSKTRRKANKSLLLPFDIYMTFALKNKCYTIKMALELSKQAFTLCCGEDASAL